MTAKVAAKVVMALAELYVEEMREALASPFPPNEFVDLVDPKLTVDRVMKDFADWVRQQTSDAPVERPFVPKAVAGTVYRTPESVAKVSDWVGVGLADGRVLTSRTPWVGIVAFDAKTMERERREPWVTESEFDAMPLPVE